MIYSQRALCLRRALMTDCAHPVLGSHQFVVLLKRNAILDSEYDSAIGFTANTCQLRRPGDVVSLTLNSVGFVARHAVRMREPVVPMLEGASGKVLLTSRASLRRGDAYSVRPSRCTDLGVMLRSSFRHV